MAKYLFYSFRGLIFDVLITTKTKAMQLVEPVKVGAITYSLKCEEREARKTTVIDAKIIGVNELCEKVDGLNLGVLRSSKSIIKAFNDFIAGVKSTLEIENKIQAACILEQDCLTGYYKVISGTFKEGKFYSGFYLKRNSNQFFDVEPSDKNASYITLKQTPNGIDKV